MNTDEFNKRIGQLTEDFIDNWTTLVDKYAEAGKLGPDHKLMVFLYSHVGIERVLSDRAWKLGSDFMDAVLKVAEELKKG